MQKEKVVHFNVKKVASHDAKGMPIIEDIIVKISPEFQVIRYINLVDQQNFLSVNVVKVLERIGDRGEFTETNEVAKFQEMVDAKLKPVEQPTDYKKAYEAQNKDIDELKAQMAELLANKVSAEDNEINPLHTKANELNIKFRSDITDEKLIERIKEVEPNFKA